MLLVSARTRYLSIAALILSAPACRETTNETTWPKLTVSGTVSTVGGRPSVATQVHITDWLAPHTCGDSIAISSATATTNSAGRYAVDIPTGSASTFTGCLRIEVGTVQFDTTVSAVPQFSSLEVNVLLP